MADDVDDEVAGVAGNDSPVRDLRQDHGDLYQAPLQAVLLCVQTDGRTLL